MPDVSPERSGWRDQRISERHRCWGFDCPGVDVDFLLIEYNHSIPVAIVEYKHERAMAVNLNAPNYRALSGLSTRSGVPLPAFLVHYADDFSWFEVQGIDDNGREFFPEKQRMTEIEWVRFLLMLRGHSLNQLDEERLRRLGHS